MAGDIIRQLPDSVANQIAAGEVIQRPSSVVKELVENSIDAGATSVDIIIKDAGKTLIQIIDNGCGMSATDARMAFQRHATSKIRQADDLFSLHTMGFRGEALPSVAAVSEIEMRTMRPEDQMGTRIVIKASKVQSQTPEVCNPGTSISVKHLFYNFVARRRFLKRDSIELSHIMHEFERLALVNPDTDLSLTHDGKVLYQLRHGPLLQRIGQLFGRTVEHQLIPLEAKTAMVNVTGFIGLPAGARQRNRLQFFFVNGRNMRHPYFQKAVLACYKDLLNGEAQPNYFINFEVPADRIDVNVHPQKHEVKFEDEAMVWQVLTAAIRESLGKYNVGPAIDFEATDVPDIPPLQQGLTPVVDSPVDDSLDPEYNPFKDEGRTHATTRVERPSALNVGNWQALYENFGRQQQPAAMPVAETESRTKDDETDLFGADEAGPEEIEIAEDFDTSMFQLKNRWIVTTAKSGLMLIDQHRAHTRILYEKFLPTVTSGTMTSQRLIFSERLEVDAAMNAVLQSSLPLLQTLGFELKHQGGPEWIIEAIPAELSDTEPRQSLLSIVADLSDTGSDPTDEQRSRIALSMARAAAVRNNRQLAPAEMQRLVSELFRLSTPSMTPDGLPIVRIVPASQLARLFHR